MKSLLLTICLFIFLRSNSQEARPVNTNDFILECMKVSGEGNNRQMAIWFPYDFWQIVGAQMKISPDVIEHVSDEMSNYIMMAVVDYTVMPGKLTFKSEEEIRPSLKLVDNAGKIFRPLENKDISSTAVTLLESLQPTMAQILGQFGEGMRVFLFEAKKVNGVLSIDVKKANSFSLSWSQVSLKWTLPFASVLPAKYCPVDHEQMKGNWSFCPFHGSKLDK